MPPRAERGRRRFAARAIAGAVLLLAAMPAYLALAPGWRPAASRLAGALLVALGGARALRWMRGAVGPSGLSPLDAPPPPAPGPELDARFVGLRDDIVSSTRNRRYFDAVLWPRLLRLAGGELVPPAPPSRRIRPRGPALGAIERMVAEIERRG